MYYRITNIIIGVLLSLGIVQAQLIDQLSNNRTEAVHLLDDWMRDPYIYLHGDGNYYLSCTQFDNPAEGIGFPVWRSTNLLYWEYMGIPYTLKMSSFYADFVNARINRGGSEDDLKLWAPEIYHFNGSWIIVHTTNAGLANIAIAQTDSLSPPYMDWGNIGGHHDPGIFTDDDGTHYLVWGATHIQKIKSDFSGFDGESQYIGPGNRKIGHEGSCIIKFENKYILFGTGWSTDTMRHGTYNLYYCTADRVTGPYGPRKFAGRFLGHGTPFQDKEGRWWCTAFKNGDLISREALREIDVDPSMASTINPQGLTLVPIEIKMVDGDVLVYALDQDYLNPGEEEAQEFPERVLSAKPDNKIDLKIYPNPAQSEMKVRASSNIEQIKIYDTKEKLIISRIIGSTSTSIPMNDIESGLYPI